MALAPTPSIINNHDASATAMRPYSDGRPAAARRGPSCMHVADDAGTVLAVIHILPPYPLMTTAPSPCAQPLHTQPCHAHACTVPGRDSVVIMPRRSVVLALREVRVTGGPVLPRHRHGRRRIACIACQAQPLLLAWCMQACISDSPVVWWMCSKRTLALLLLLLQACVRGCLAFTFLCKRLARAAAPALRCG